MSWFSEVTDPISSTSELIKNTGNAIDELFTSDDERNTAEILKAKIKQNPRAWAHQLNVINAQSRRWFDSGWRPALGWVGAIGLFLYYIPQYFLAAVLWVRMCWDADVLVPYPVTADGLMELVGLLIGGMVVRGLDKKSGTAR